MRIFTLTEIRSIVELGHAEYNSGLPFIVRRIALVMPKGFELNGVGHFKFVKGCFISVAVSVEAGEFDLELSKPLIVETNHNFDLRFDAGSPCECNKIVRGEAWPKAILFDRY